MFERKYRYHVVYNYRKGNNVGLGSCSIQRSSKIKNDFDINSLRQEIKSDDEYDNIVILNWIRLM